jgi:hypothetical protein
MQHTPGPWTADTPTAIQWPTDYINITDETGGIVAQTLCHTSPEVTAANARLIAACPELLAALSQFVSYADNGKHASWAIYMATHAGAKARAAIAKTTGGRA